MFQSMRTEKAKLRTALKLATAALAFYGNAESYQFRQSNPATPVIIIDRGKLARTTLGNISAYLNDDAQRELRRCELMAGDNDR